MRRHRAVDRALELLDLAARDILETGPDPLHRVGLLPLCLFGKVALPVGEARLELVDRPAALGRVRLELAPHYPESIVERSA